MLTAEEVRVGNKVNFGLVPVTVQGVHTVQITTGRLKHHFYVSDFIKVDNYYCVEPYNLSGIELTPEILEKCGFYKGEHEMAGEMHVIDIQKSAARTLFITHGPSMLAVLCEENNGEIALEFVKYLHEVQNLYFALTQKELIYKQ